MFQLGPTIVLSLLNIYLCTVENDNMYFATHTHLAADCSCPDVLSSHIESHLSTRH